MEHTEFRNAEIQTDESVTNRQNQEMMTDPEEVSSAGKKDEGDDWDADSYKMKLYMEKIDEKDAKIDELNEKIRQITESNGQLNSEIDLLQDKNKDLESKIGKFSPKFVMGCNFVLETAMATFDSKM